MRVKAEPFVVIEDHGVAETARRTRGKLCRDLCPLVILGPHAVCQRKNWGLRKALLKHGKPGFGLKSPINLGLGPWPSSKAHSNNRRKHTIIIVRQN